MSPVTFPTALAALTARCGEPADVRNAPGVAIRSVAWTTPDHSACVVLYESGGAVWIEIAHTDDLRARNIHLAGERMLTPLDEAVDAAAGWLARATAPAGAEERR